MDRLVHMLATLASADARPAWSEVVAGIRRTLDDPLRGLPVLGFLLLAIAAVWANVRVARWLTSTRGGPADGRRGSSS